MQITQQCVSLMNVLYPSSEPHLFCLCCVQREVGALAGLLVNAADDEALGVTSVSHPYHLLTSMTDDSFPFLCLTQGCYFPLAGQYFMFSAKATLWLHCQRLLFTVCKSKEHSVKLHPSGNDFYFKRDSN